MRIAAITKLDAVAGSLEPRLRANSPREVLGMCSLIPDFSQCPDNVIQALTAV